MYRMVRSIIIYTSLCIALFLSIGSMHAQTTYFTFSEKTGNNATVIIPVEINPLIEDNPIQPGDEIGVFTGGGLCVGGRIWTGENISITVWENNPFTEEIDGITVGERLYFRIWEETTGKEYDKVRVVFSPESPTNNNGIYTTDGIFLLDSLRTDATVSAPGNRGAIPDNHGLMQNYPNPFNPTTIIGFMLSEDGWVKIELYNTTGERISVLLDEHRPAGYHNIIVPMHHHAAGTYFYRMRAKQFTQTRKLILVK